MSSRNRPSADVLAPAVGVAYAQKSLPFDSARRDRDETKLLHALTKAFAVLVGRGGQESALRESFVHAMEGLGAEKGVLVQVRQPQPLELEILYATGLTPENEAACVSLRSSPGISPTLIRKTIEERQPTAHRERSDAGSGCDRLSA